MTEINELVSQLNEDQRIQLISALTEQLSYPPLEQHLEQLTIDDKKRLIRSIVNTF